MFGLSVKEKLDKALRHLCDEKLSVFKTVLTEELKNCSIKKDIDDAVLLATDHYSREIIDTLSKGFGQTISLRVGLALQSPRIAGLPDEIDTEYIIENGQLVGFYFALFYYAITGNKIVKSDYEKFVLQVNKYQLDLITPVVETIPLPKEEDVVVSNEDEIQLIMNGGHLDRNIAVAVYGAIISCEKIGNSGLIMKLLPEIRKQLLQKHGFFGVSKYGYILGIFQEKDLLTKEEVDKLNDEMFMEFLTQEASKKQKVDERNQQQSKTYTITPKPRINYSAGEKQASEHKNVKVKVNTATDAKKILGNAPKSIPYAYAKSSEELGKNIEIKEPYMYSILEPFDLVDMAEVLSYGYGKTPFGRCRLIAENYKYKFLGFDPVSPYGIRQEYILRMAKNETAEVRYFGESRNLGCILEEFLFLSDRNCGLNGSSLYRNIETGEEHKFYCYRDPEGAMGHFMSYDYMNEMTVSSNELHLKMSRFLGDFHNEDSDYKSRDQYTLIIKIINGEPRLMNPQPWKNNDVVQ